ncbi:unnamed protein product [Pelagomonas calceolata]|uniref:J domain-containing protein n=1 Tax=Pelagomonas calceolata TaxID=35677 RepID=A0A8J2S4W9_9STRA|nr:unnamed protein product [Pelagomonas calceolata]
MARRSAWSPRSPPRRRRADDDDDEMSTEVLQITMAWERKRKQAEADLRDQLNEAEDTITEMGDKVAKLERDLAAAKHDAEIASDMVKSVTAEKAELARDLKDEQVRVLGALFLIADLAQEPPKEDEDDADTPVAASEPADLPPPPPADENTPPPELTRVCAECEKPCPKASYSNKQWQAKAATRRCRACVEGDAAAAASPPPSPTKSETPEEEEEEDPETAAPPEDAAVAARKAEILRRRRTHAAALRVASALKFSPPSQLVDASALGRAPDRAFTEARESLRDAGESVLSLGVARAAVGRHARVAQQLLDLGANAERACCDVEAMPEWPVVAAPATDVPALHAAIVAGHDAVAKLLVTRGANANATSTRLGGATPLHAAARHNRSELARFLVSKCNARLDAVDDEGQTAADCASKMRWTRTEKVLRDPGLLFWARAARANRLCKEGEHALALDSYDQALAELAKLPKNDARYPKSQSVATLQHNRARSLMALGQFLAARNGLLEACLAAGGDAKYPVAADRRAECDAKLLEHAKAAEAWESLADDADDVQKARTWRSKAQAERAKASRRPHELLGLESPRCSPAELKKAYRKKSLQWHPDRQASGTPEHKYRAHLMFQRISAAHDELQESSSRPRYATYWSEESEGSDQESEEEDLYESTPAWHRYFDRAKARS